MKVDNVGLVILAVVVAVLLIFLPFYAGTFAPGHVLAQYHYDHEIEAGPTDNVTGGVELGSGVELDKRLDEGTDIEDLRYYEYEKLSPTARVLFDRTLNTESGKYTPVVCENYVLVCDGYYEQDLPAEFTYGEGAQDELRYSVIESNGDEYLLRTGISLGGAWATIGEFWLMYFLRGLMILHGVAIIAATAVRLSDRWTVTTDGLGYSALVGTGALFAVLSFLTPYLQMYGGIKLITLLLATGGVTTTGYIYASFMSLLSR